jgi:transposase InsO family protein
MKEQRGLYRIKIMCRALKVSRSGYYAWRKRMPSKSEIANNKLLESIRDIYRKNRKVYGSPRITDELNDYGMRCGENRVARLMKENGIRAHVRKKFKRTTDSRHKFQASENLLIQGNKSVYVSAIMDIRSRRIIGLSIKNRLTQELTTDALLQAVKRKRPGKGLIHHSDRGKQYASYAYQKLLKKYGIRSSMNRSGNYYDNAHIESFWGTLKKELVFGQRYQTRKEARLSIFEYIEVFYNRFRKHSALGYKSPEQYDMLLNAT